MPTHPSKMSDEDLKAAYEAYEARNASQQRPGLLEQALGAGVAFRGKLLNAATGGLVTPHPFQQQAIQDNPGVAQVGDIGGKIALGGLLMGAGGRGGASSESPIESKAGPFKPGPFNNFPPKPGTALYEPEPITPSQGASNLTVERFSPPPAVAEAPPVAGPAQAPAPIEKAAPKPGLLGKIAASAGGGVLLAGAGQKLWEHRHELAEPIESAAVSVLPDWVLEKIGHGIDSATNLTGKYKTPPHKMSDTELRAAYDAYEKANQK